MHRHRSPWNNTLRCFGHNKLSLVAKISLLPVFFCFFFFKAFCHLALIPKCFRSTRTCKFSTQNERLK